MLHLGFIGRSFHLRNRFSLIGIVFFLVHQIEPGMAMRRYQVTKQRMINAISRENVFLMTIPPYYVIALIISQCRTVWKSLRDDFVGSRFLYHPSTVNGFLICLVLFIDARFQKEK